MISADTIQEVTDRLVKTYNPLQIYLFGSYAWGHPTEDSDLDLLIVIDKSDIKTYKRSIPGDYALVGMKIPTDILVFTKEEFKRLSNDVTTLCHKIKNEGTISYANLTPGSL